MLYLWALAAAPALRVALPASAPALRMRAAPVMEIPEHKPPAGIAPVFSSVARSKAPPVADSSIIVQGGSLRTWSYTCPSVEQVQLILCTEGRPLDATIELWRGPDNTPCTMRIFVENGQHRPFRSVVQTPRGPNTVAIRNVGQIEFPITANVFAENVDSPSADSLATSKVIQGGALRTYPFDPSVNTVEVLLKTEGLPLNARIELLQGPNNIKQVIELYTEEGSDRPFFCFLETPGSSNVVRVVNTGPVTFPMTASVVAAAVDEEAVSDAVLGGGDIVGIGKGASGKAPSKVITPSPTGVTLASERPRGRASSWLSKRADEEAAEHQAMMEQAAAEQAAMVEQAAAEQAAEQAAAEQATEQAVMAALESRAAAAEAEAAVERARVEAALREAEAAKEAAEEETRRLIAEAEEVAAEKARLEMEAKQRREAEEDEMMRQAVAEMERMHIEEAEEEQKALVKAAEEEEARVKAEEEQKAAAEEEVRVKAEEEEEARVKAAAEEEARVKAAAEEEARVKAAEEELAKAALAVEAERATAAEARVKAAEEELAKAAVAVEAERATAAEEARARAVAEEERARAEMEKARAKVAEEEMILKAAEEEVARAKAVEEAERAARAKAAEEERMRAEVERARAEAAAREEAELTARAEAAAKAEEARAKAAAEAAAEAAAQAKAAAEEREAAARLEAVRAEAAASKNVEDEQADTKAAWLAKLAKREEAKAAVERVVAATSPPSIDSVLPLPLPKQDPVLASEPALEHMALQTSIEALRQRLAKKGASPPQHVIEERLGLPPEGASTDAPAEWTPAKVGEWLGAVGLGEHADTFVEQEVDGATLEILTRADLKDLGVGKVGHQLKILKALRELGVGADAPDATRASQKPAVQAPKEVARR